MELDWAWVLIRLLVSTVILGFVLIVAGFCTLILRKIGARIQQRLGPNRTGPNGWLQWLADLVKMVSKESIIPAGADRVVFWLAPIVSGFAATMAWAFIPFGEHITLFGHTIPYYISDTPVGLLALLAFSSLGVYGLIMGAWGSNSKFALLGGLRASAQVVSYEVTMGISLIGPMMLAQSLNLNDLARAQGGALASGGGNLLGTPGVWLILLQPLAFFTYLISALAETNYAPFDLPESESELVAGYHVEYSGMQFGLYQAAEFVNVITVSAIATYCFLGGWQPIIPIGGAALGPLWFFLKASVLIFVFQWVRWTVPRFRYDQLMGICWKGMLPLVIANILLLAILRAWVPPDAPPLGHGTLEQSIPWLIFIGVELVCGVASILAISRVLVSNWWGKSEKPVMIGAAQTGRPAPLLGVEGTRAVELRTGLPQMGAAVAPAPLPPSLPSDR